MDKQLSLRTSSTEPPMQATKWLTSQVLLDADEMQELFNALGDFYIFQTSGVCKTDEGSISRNEFIAAYRDCISMLQKGLQPNEGPYRKLFSSVLTVSLDTLYAIPLADNQHLIRISKPVIQMQIHHMDYSQADSKFRSMVFGSDSIWWGIQFSYPQLYQNQQTHQAEQVVISTTFPNTQLYRDLQYWIRHHTIPTPMILNQQTVNLPMRLGKNCLSWINCHPQLIKKGLQVKC